MKNKYIVVFVIIILFVLFGSVFVMWNNIALRTSSEIIKENVSFNDGVMTVSYVTGKNINENIGYNNHYISKLILKNNSNKELSYSVYLDGDDQNDFYYTLSASKDNKNFKDIYDGYFKNYLGYNLIIESGETVYLNITFKPGKEEKGIVKGNLRIKNNISLKEFFIFENKASLNYLKNYINSLRGIRNSGVYIFNVSSIENNNIKGFIVTDANDVTNIKYYLYTYSNNVAFNRLDGENININEILNYDGTYNEMNEENICFLYTGSSNCRLISDLVENDLGSKEEFYNNSLNILNNVKKIDNISGKVTVINVTTDITNTNGIVGYVLVDWLQEKPEYYLYITNTLYMISGYNVSKNGEDFLETGTIRQFNQSAFNLSSADYMTVCNFSGFNECYTLNN